LKPYFPGGVENITSRQFMDIWKNKMANVPSGAVNADAGPYVNSGSATVQRILDMTEGDPERRNAALTELNHRTTALYTSMQRDIAMDNHQEAIAKRELDNFQRGNFGNLMADAVEGKEIPQDQLADMLRHQHITPAQSNAVMAEMRRKGRGDDDVQTVVDLQRRVNAHEDVSGDIDKALDSGLITGKTAIRLTKAIGTQIETPLERGKFDQLKTIGNGNAVEKGLVDLTNEHGKEVAARWSQMQGEWLNRVRINREDPNTVYDDMAARWAPVVNSPIALPRPKFTTEFVPSGKIDNEADLNKVAVGTMQKHDAKLMSDNEYARDVALINQYRSYFKSVTPVEQPKAATPGKKPKVIGRQPESVE
jgi:hypothetical protein